MQRDPFSHPIALLRCLYPGSFPDIVPDQETHQEKAVEGLWTTEQAAEYVGVHVETLRKWVRLGKFPRIPLPGRGKDLRFAKAMIDSWAEERALGAKKIR